MKVFFDNNTSPVLAATLGGFVRHLHHSAHHIMDLPCGRDAADVDWMKMLGESGEDWIVVTKDLRITRNRAERAAFRQAGLKGFVLAGSVREMATHHVAGMLVWRWPDMERLMASVAAPALFELPLGKRSAQFRPLPL